MSLGRAAVITSEAVTPLGEGAVESGFLYRASHPVMRESALLDALDQNVTMCVRAWRFDTACIEERTAR